MRPEATGRRVVVPLLLTACRPTPEDPTHHQGALPGAHCHLVWVMDVGTTVATVALAKAVVIHAVLFGLLLLVCLSDNGEASLDRTACFWKQSRASYNQ